MGRHGNMEACILWKNRRHFEMRNVNGTNKDAEDFLNQTVEQAMEL